MDVGMVLDLVTAGLVAAGLVLWRSMGAGAEQAAREQATEVVNRLNWPATLQRELERLRGAERQESRFESYGRLWAAMRPLAIYDESPVSRTTMTALSRALSDWYFSEKGGLMLTKLNRDLYFVLQDLLRATTATPDEWTAERASWAAARFDDLLRSRGLEGALRLRHVLDAMEPREWPGGVTAPLVEEWRHDIRILAESWHTLDEQERFVVLQQVSSVLRTGLANDVESRLR